MNSYKTLQYDIARIENEARRLRAEAMSAALKRVAHWFRKPSLHSRPVRGRVA